MYMTTGALASEASTLATLSETAAFTTPTTYFLTTTSNDYLSTVALSSSIVAAQREASDPLATPVSKLTASTFTSTSASTSIFVTDGHTTTSITSVITTGVAIVPASTNGASPTLMSKPVIGLIAAATVLVVITLIFYRFRKIASGEQKMSEFTIFYRLRKIASVERSDYPPRPNPFLVTSAQPRPLSSMVTRLSRIFSIALSAAPSSNPTVLGSTRQSVSIVATAGENTDFDDEKADLTVLGQCASSHLVPGKTASHRSHSTLVSADSDPPPLYTATEIDFTSVLGGS
ncbi:hypothetical protein BDP27DRAFT_1397865 [Rhodocollybia butyracea]|uniref:Uncharacterized protein n=1 Tax=Rhodocollybia butyracea TaxID=206335 RepID=A0A9P5Q8M1_9AGAR|nr:hypothetical protein BDP27DRAFT_1397865 [Rhodocollybia butyracea]